MAKANTKKKPTTKAPTKGTTTKASEPKATKKDLGLNPSKSYKFVSNGKGPGMENDAVITVSGQVAQILFDKGYGQIKE